MKPKLTFAMDSNKTRHVLDDKMHAELAACADVLSPAALEEFESSRARSLLAETEILVTGWGCPFVSREVLAAAPNLRLIAHAAGTIKYILDPAVFEAGILVTNAADANAVPVAEYTLAAVIFANKRILELRDLYRTDNSRRSTWALMDEPIGNYNRTIGLVGASRIGRKVAALLGHLDVEVLIADPYVTAGDPVLDHATLVDLETLLKRSDVVSLHAPSLPVTRHMIGREELALMRDGATVINTARGALVDEDAFIAELQSGRLHAVIDVTEPEIPSPDSPLFHLPNVFLTPHIAGAAGTERLRLGRVATDEVKRFIADDRLQYLVEPDSLERLA